MTKIDENIQTAEKLLGGIVERCYELEKENKSLKDDLIHYIQREEEYRKQIDKLKSENEYRNNIADIIPEGKGNVAEETIRDLQDRIKELVEELEKLKEKYGDIDY